MNDRGPRVCPRCGSRYPSDAAFCRNDGTRLHEAGEHDPRIGQLLHGQFRIEEKVGAGGMGDVYRAHQVTLERDVAIKILHAGLADNPDAVRRFQREARISIALDHPNIVRVFLSGQLPDRSLYLVMELLRGRALADLLRVEPNLPILRVMHILAQICAGIGEAHEQGIVHRDVKPENVMLVTKGRDADFVKVVDFGIARITRPDEHTQATQAGLVVGTVRYISPEGAAGQSTDARSDVYSIGVLAYQMLCGEVPFDAQMPIQLLMKHLHEPALPLKMRPGGANVPDEIANIVMRALSKNPDGRYADATELGEVLAEAAQRLGIHAPRLREPSPHTQSSMPAVPPTEPPRRRGVPAWLVGGLAFCVGVLMVLGIVAFVRGPRPPTPAEERQALVSSAEDALVAHRWDGHDGVREITDRVLAEYPGDADALRVRHDAALFIVHEGDHERDRGQRHEAEHRYEQAESLDPTSEAHARIQELAQQAPRRPRGIVVSPSAVEHEQATLTATLDGDRTMPEGASPHFVIVQARRSLHDEIPATATGAEGSYDANYTFPIGGSYRIEFVAGTYTFATNIEVARSTHLPHGTSP